MNKKLVGLKNTLNAKYQHSIHKIADTILNGEKTMTVSDFMHTSVFQNINNVNVNELKKKITSIVGEDIDKNELKTLLVLLDANLENIDEEGKESNKFIMDLRFRITKNNGIFQATQSEIANLKQDISVIYDYDDPKSTLFPTPNENALYDKNDKYVGKMDVNS